jgi:DNA-binding beta-propeller fold protein YncE
MRHMGKLVLALVMALSAGCGGGGGDSGGLVTSPPNPPTPPAPTLATNAQIELSLGTTLQKPVFQCGSGTDTVSADVAPGSVTVFESGPVRPVALSADGQRLYVTNTPANCLEIYAVQGDGLRLVSTVAVGMEPVAVAERNANEIWVVNHLSDSVSIVRLDGTPRVLRTLLVGDEPRDIVFAGANRDRAFITAAARGQNRPGFTGASLVTPALGRADVWVFDATALDDSLNGKPLTIVTLFADTPRALAASVDGSKVYAAPFMSGNRTTTLHRDALGAAKPLPNRSADNVVAPGTGLIVRFDGSAWRDEAGTNWSARVKFTLPDFDLFAIDATAAVPAVTTQVSGVGTTLFNLAVHPVTGAVYASNTHAQNHIRFEGPGRAATTVRGRIAESRISIVNVAANRIDVVHLNSHIDFALPQGATVAAGDKARSLAQPTAMVFSPDGTMLYTAAFGSGKVAALPAASLTPAAFAPDSSAHISVPPGPAGLALNASGSRLYVYSRIAHAVSVIDTGARTVLGSVNLFAPESTAVRTGRQFLYDATETSANGTSSCGSCHIFGDMDQLAWDLGNPDDVTKNNPNAYVPNVPKTTFRFHPMKGPMGTQTLRGMRGNGPLHWRGDRTGINRQTVRGSLESLEEASFKEFNSAFVGLVGREAELGESQMQSFTDFAMALSMPPNPVRALNNALNEAEQAGRDIYFNNNTITLLGSCNNCHALNPAARQFGTAGLMAFEGLRITENFKVPQLRNVYQKAGMFGFSLGTGAATGQQIRGFGFSHDGSVDTLDSFLSDPVFNFPAPAAITRAQVAAFVLAMDSDLAPIVGQQITWRPNTNPVAETQLGLLKQQAASVPRAACDLIVRANTDGAVHAGLFQTDGTWLMKTGERLADTALRGLASASQPLTFTCLPPGAGRRVALNLP